MRLLLSLALAVGCAAAAHASTIRDDFTYTYVLSGNTYVNTFSLIDGQTASVPAPGYTALAYSNVALNGDPTATTTIKMGAQTYSFTSNGTFTGFTGFSIFIIPSGQTALYDVSSGTSDDIIKTYSKTSLTFNPGTYALANGAVQLGGTRTPFDSSSIAIAQTVLADPTPTPIPDPTPTPTPAPVAVTPEPGTLTLLCTGLLGVASVARRKVMFA